MSITENGALSHSTTGSSVLDLFFKTTRTTSADQVAEMMKSAWSENPLLTLKAVFHLRDCRGGKGEKARFYDCIRWLTKNGHIEHVVKNLTHVSFYGSFKDLLVLGAGTELETAMLTIFADALHADIAALTSAIESGNINTQGHANVELTLAAKWAPTEGGSFDRKHKLAAKITSAMNGAGILSLKDYRTKVLTPLRNHLEITERYMCSQNWDEIDFSHVPSIAMKNYRKAFELHEENRFKKYLEDVKSGATKINAGQVFPHQLVKHYMGGGAYDETIELQWKEIVKTAKSKFGNNTAFPLVDVSGSMSGEPMEVAIALGLLLSEITCDQFKGSMLTFHENPTIFRVNTNLSLMDKIAKIQKAPWGGSTNLAKAFDQLLNFAVTLNVPATSMPKTLYIFSDMQFDQASSSNSHTNFQNIERKYKDAGYARPNIVFWNLRGNTVDFPVEQHVPNTALVSGFSPSLMELFMTGNVISPYAVMLEALSNPRYSKITL